MASVAILLHGTAPLADQLGKLLDCPVLDPGPVAGVFAAQLGQADADRIRSLALDALWPLAAESEAGVIIVVDGAEPDAVRRGLASAGSPRTVVLSAGADFGEWPIVQVDPARLDPDRLLQQLGAAFL